jgi:hypothetical protein
MILYGRVKYCKCKKRKILKEGDFIMFLVISQPNGPFPKKNPSKHARATN